MKKWVQDIYWHLYKRNKKIDQLRVFPLSFSTGSRIWLEEEDLYKLPQLPKLKDFDLGEL